jgi:hypothetical protein
MIFSRGSGLPRADDMGRDCGASKGAGGPAFDFDGDGLEHVPKKLIDKVLAE